VNTQADMPVGPQSEPHTSNVQIPPAPGAPRTPPPSTAAPAPGSPAAAQARPAVAPRPAAPVVPAADLAGKLTTPAATTAKVPAATAASKRAADDTSPLMSRRGWMSVAWVSFTAASAAALAATGRFMFPNVINEPPAQFKIGLPSEYGIGVDERFKETMGVWIVRTPDDVVQHASGFFALLVTCTHLGCTPNYLAAEGKFKCPCHGSGFRAASGINFEGPAPRPLERARIVLADDGQILVDKSRKFQFELGQWEDPEAFLKA
jgi:cytochrome b6-f complex iron-sulfur subunit